MKKRITRNDIFKTAFKLQDEGKEVSSTLIREELGSGSLSTITKYLKEWLSEKELVDDESIDIREVVQVMESDVLVEFFSNELPQVSALVFSYLDPKKAASVLKQFSNEKRNQILSRMEKLEFVQSRIVEHVAKILEFELRSISLSRGEQVGGKKFVNSIKAELAG